MKPLSGTFTIVNLKYENRAVLPSDEREAGLACVVPLDMVSINDEAMWTLTPILGDRYSIKNVRYNHFCATRKPSQPGAPIVGVEKPLSWWIIEEQNVAIYGPNTYIIKDHVRRDLCWCPEDEEDGSLIRITPYALQEQKMWRIEPCVASHPALLVSQSTARSESAPLVAHRSKPDVNGLLKDLDQIGQVTISHTDNELAPEVAWGSNSKSSRTSGNLAMVYPVQNDQALDLQTHASKEADTSRRAISLSNEQLAKLIEMSDEDKKTYIDLLDEVLKTTTEEETSLKIFRVLRGLCAMTGSLPRSFYIPSAMLQKQEPQSKDFGGFADVWLGRYMNQNVALKIVRIHPNERENAFAKEAVCWRHVSHPNVVPFLGVEDSDIQFCMVSTWMPNGNLVSYLKTNPLAGRLELITDIIKGLRHLHSLHVVHGDLKGANVLIDGQGRACLSDFGLTAVASDAGATVGATATASAAGTSVRWTAPELLNPEYYNLSHARATYETDVYALAMVMYEIFSGQLPFYEQRNDGAVIRCIIYDERPSRPSQASSLGLSDSVWRLMQECWRSQPDIRPPLPILLKRLSW
ncbi:uncharacterized protein FIBRA_08158 [Fibroporia radiculosa]|uniref:Protein kinase domain-containing protein n=1 Tax=Fibroporia radiculosa TaxID=599839 RepID=J4GWB2_9APHY|nr:uncharacterized protein FIBRA_08158 [Fibroporia radiculosa]CCM05920.1 predicted protein [Fibroporia radiculosa]